MIFLSGTSQVGKSSTAQHIMENETLSTYYDIQVLPSMVRQSRKSVGADYGLMPSHAYNRMSTHIRISRDMFVSQTTFIKSSVLWAKTFGQRSQVKKPLLLICDRSLYDVMSYWAAFKYCGVGIMGGECEDYPENLAATAFPFRSGNNEGARRTNLLDMHNDIKDLLTSLNFESLNLLLHPLPGVPYDTQNDARPNEDIRRWTHVADSQLFDEQIQYDIENRLKVMSFEKPPTDIWHYHANLYPTKEGTPHPNTDGDAYQRMVLNIVMEFCLQYGSYALHCSPRQSHTYMLKPLEP